MIQPKDVTTILNYHLPPSQGGADALYLGTVGEKRSQHAQVTAKILDMRARPKEDFGLDTTGFQLLSWESPEKKYDNDSKITSIYYNDCMDLIKSVTGATKVLPLGHLIRRMAIASALELDKDLDNGARSIAPTPANFVHIDQSYDGAVNRVVAKFPNELEKVGHKR